MNRAYAKHILRNLKSRQDSGMEVAFVECHPEVIELITPYLPPGCSIIENSSFTRGVHYFYTEASYKSNKREIWYVSLFNTLKQLIRGILNE